MSASRRPSSTLAGAVLWLGSLGLALLAATAPAAAGAGGPPDAARDAARRAGPDAGADVSPSPTAGGSVGPASPDTPGPLFARLDTDRDGAVTPREFRVGYPALQQAIAVELRLREQFRRVDADRSGALEAGEYAKLALVQRDAAAAPPLARFDADRSGRLSFAEYVAAVSHLAARGSDAPAASRARTPPAPDAAR